ncbi:hypothetical protein GOP47_0011720 [Adiantum capillus-veneris]|uniref:Uncharacterized protein n=1 Tax=Adiantum capillus-veneris TaxID=13818 RepID=A0A9D4UUP8_ADICA|nr:hypothetical protein GOP47_0011720 [Adiantum capillus-veneris]
MEWTCRAGDWAARDEGFMLRSYSMKSLLKNGHGSAGGEADPPGEEVQLTAEDGEAVVQRETTRSVEGP